MRRINAKSGLSAPSHSPLQPLQPSVSISKLTNAEVQTKARAYNGKRGEPSKIFTDTHMFDTLTFNTLADERVSMQSVTHADTSVVYACGTQVRD